MKFKFLDRVYVNTPFYTNSIGQVMQAHFYGYSSEGEEYAYDLVIEGDITGQPIRVHEANLSREPVFK